MSIILFKCKLFYNYFIYSFLTFLGVIWKDCKFLKYYKFCLLKIKQNLKFISYNYNLGFNLAFNFFGKWANTIVLFLINFSFSKIAISKLIVSVLKFSSFIVWFLSSKKRFFLLKSIVVFLLFIKNCLYKFFLIIINYS